MVADADEPAALRVMDEFMDTLCVVNPAYNNIMRKLNRF